MDLELFSNGHFYRDDSNSKMKQRHTRTLNISLNSKTFRMQNDFYRGFFYQTMPSSGFKHIN